MRYMKVAHRNRNDIDAEVRTNPSGRHGTLHATAMAPLEAKLVMYPTPTPYSVDSSPVPVSTNVYRVSTYPSRLGRAKLVCVAIDGIRLRTTQ